jgi:carbamoyltransferase
MDHAQPTGGRIMSTHVLGISAFFHDSAAALLRDGEIVAAAQEERFTRKKQDPDFPARAVEYCLSAARIGAGDLDVIAFYEKPFVKFERLLDTFCTNVPGGYPLFREALPDWAGRKLHLSRVIREAVGADFRGRVVFTEHHESHAASAFFPSPFEEAAILTLDAVGEWSTTALGHGVGSRIELSQELRFPHSLGMLYSAVTFYTGFKVNSGEYKLMGLAPYGRPIYRDVLLDRVAHVDEDGSLRLDMSYFAYLDGLTMTSERFHELFDGPPRPPESTITQKEMDLAASIQAVCEEIVLRAGQHVHRQTGSRRLVMAGGVALNCVANGRLLRQGPFEEIWVQPAAGDAGGALGAALLAWHHMMDQPRQVVPRDAQKGSLLGPEYDDDEIGVFLDAMGARYHRVDDEDALLDQVASLLASDKVVGWFHGRMEFGPRALGARSILGDARSPRMQKTMNLKIKYRESFRPFAPCVLREHVSQYFDTAPEQDWPYMLFVADVQEERRLPLSEDDHLRMSDPDLRTRVSVPRSTIPAVTHVDYSARVQTVDEARHGRYYRLIKRFYEQTGCPVIVNTSFNIRGEPIVCAPDDAFRCFMATDMDCLVVENHLLLKTEQPHGLAVDADAYRAQFSLD